MVVCTDSAFSTKPVSRCAARVATVRSRKMCALPSPGWRRAGRRLHAGKPQRCRRLVSRTRPSARLRGRTRVASIAGICSGTHLARRRRLVPARIGDGCRSVDHNHDAVPRALPGGQRQLTTAHVLATQTAEPGDLNSVRTRLGFLNFGEFVCELAFDSMIRFGHVVGPTSLFC